MDLKMMRSCWSKTICALLILSSPSHAQLIFLEDFELREQVLFAEPAVPFEDFGRSVAISEDVIVVGVPRNAMLGSRAGAVYVFKQDVDKIWREITVLTASDGEPGEFFGRTVAISGSRIAIGAANSLRDGNLGKVYVFELTSSGEWEETAMLFPTKTEQNGFFGRAVDLDGDILVVGDFGVGEQTGEVLVFERSEHGVWEGPETIHASDAKAGDGFGFSLAISGESIVVGTGTLTSAAEKAYVFDRQPNGGWVESDILRAPAGEPGDLFGLDVDIYKNVVVVGATGDNDSGNGSGAVYLFERTSESDWAFNTKLKAETGGELRGFGFLVELGASRLLVAAEQETFINGFSGAVHVFDLQPDGNWRETSKRSPVNPESGDAFGSALALDRTRAIVGAPADEAKGAAGDSGAAYFFN